MSQPSHVTNSDLTGASNFNTKRLDARQTARAAEINTQANKKVDKITVSKKLLTNMDEQIAYLLKKRATVIKELDLTEQQLAMGQELLTNMTKTRSASPKGAITSVRPGPTRPPDVEPGPTWPPEAHAQTHGTKPGDWISMDPADNGTVMMLPVENPSGATGAVVETIWQEPTMALAGAPQKEVQHDGNVNHDNVTDPFKKITVEIDKMIIELSNQQDQHSRLTGTVDDEYDHNNIFTEMGEDLKDLVNSIKCLTGNVAETQVQLRMASEILELDEDDSDFDGDDYLQTLTDQINTRAIIKQAIIRMDQVLVLLMSQKCFAT